MALSIAKGEKLLGRETKRGTSLYLCLEDSYTRIQNRLFELTSEPSENLHFAIMAGILGGILEKQIEQCKAQHADLKIIIIDTLQKIRSGDEVSYTSDYKELSVEKQYFKGSATILVTKLKMQFGVEIPSNKITQNLVQYGVELKSFGVTFEVKRSCGLRFLILKYERESDSGDSCSLWVEIAVTPYPTNALIILNNDGDGTTLK